MGIGLCLFAQISYASYFVLFKNSISKYHPITQMKWMFLFAAIIYLPLNLHQLVSTDFSAVPASILGGRDRHRGRVWWGREASREREASMESLVGISARESLVGERGSEGRV